MLERMQALERTIAAMIKTELNLKEDVFTNKLIPTWSEGNGETTEVLDEAAMRAKAKQGTALPPPRPAPPRPCAAFARPCRRQ
jgi:hypothetical protein